MLQGDQLKMNLTKKKKRKKRKRRKPWVEGSGHRGRRRDTEWREQMEKMCYWLLAVYHDSVLSAGVCVHACVCRVCVRDHRSLPLMNAFTQPSNLTGVSQGCRAVPELPPITNIIEPPDCNSTSINGSVFLSHTSRGSGSMRLHAV